MKSWIAALSRTRNTLRDIAQRVLGTGAVDGKTLDELEVALIRADVPARLAGEWMEALRRGPAKPSALVQLQTIIRATLPNRDAFAWQSSVKPRVVAIVGVNGSGKTTTAAKLARCARQNGCVPLLAATDTFRAAGSDQLRIWAQRVECAVVAGKHGADAAAVAYDAVQAAIARQCDIAFIDTAGRMHTKQHLMVELQKICRSMDKALPGAPHETWIVLDASLGSNAIKQASMFKDSIGLTGAVIAKLDGSSKAGFVLALEKELGLAIRFVGLGEGMDDLAPFDAAEFSHALIEGEADG